MRYFRCATCKEPLWEDKVLSGWWPCWTKAHDKGKCDSRLCQKCAQKSRYCKTCQAEKALTKDEDRDSVSGHEMVAGS